MQAVKGGVIAAVDLAGYSVTRVQPGPALTCTTGLSCEPLDGGYVLRNDQVSFRLDQAAHLVSANRAGVGELINGLGNQWQCFEDRPVCWDAWDIDAYFEDHQIDLSDAVEWQVLESGPLRCRLRATRHWQSSRIQMDFVLHHDHPRLDVECVVDWYEPDTLVKVAFPTLVESDTVDYQIQWGTINRPAHRNTDRAAAMFEVPAQRFADLSDGDLGLAVLNDCKYGYDTRDGVVRLTLIKTSTSPSPKADQAATDLLTPCCHMRVIIAPRYPIMRRVCRTCRRLADRG